MAAELEYYKEQLEHGRHIEVQRSTAAGLSITFAGAMIGEVLKRHQLTRDELPYTVTLFFLGAITWLLVAKLYERFRLHNAIAALARDRLDPGLREFRKLAETETKKEYPFLFAINLHVIWNLLFASITALGLITSLIILYRLYGR